MKFVKIDRLPDFTFRSDNKYAALLIDILASDLDMVEIIDESITKANAGSIASRFRHNIRRNDYSLKVVVSNGKIYIARTDRN